MGSWGRILGLAAKAADVEIGEIKEPIGYPAWGWDCVVDGVTHSMWSPFTDDGDAFRLMVKLGIKVDIGNTKEPDVYKATRYAIVKRAARIGEEMKDGNV